MPTCMHPSQKHVNMNTESLNAHFNIQPACLCQHITDIREAVVAQSASKYTESESIKVIHQLRMCLLPGGPLRKRHVA